MKDLKDELKTCPFCGSEAEVIEVGNEFTKKRLAKIKCTGCHTEMIVGAIHNSLDWCKVTVIEKWNKRLESQLQEKPTRTAEEIQSTKEGLYIERIKNLQAIIRHCDCPINGNPRFDMVVELTKKDKEFALAINLLADASASQFNPIEAKEPKELREEEIDKIITDDFSREASKTESHT